MVKDFKTKNGDGRLIISKQFFGIGFHLNFVEPYTYREIIYSISIDFMFIRFWFQVFKKKWKQ